MTKATKLKLVDDTTMPEARNRRRSNRLPAAESVAINQNASADAFNVMIENLQEGVCMFDAEQRLIVCNRLYAEIYNVPTHLLQPGTLLIDILKQRIKANNFPKIEGDAYIANRMKAVTDAEVKTEIHQLRDGRVISVKHNPVAGGGWVTTHSDITKIYELTSEVEHLAFHDQLTDLPNRRLFNQRLDEATREQSKDLPLVLMFIDLDGFKSINDSHGHDAGDRVLQVVASRLVHSSREEDTIARLGGDEFAVLQSGIRSLDTVKAIADRLVSAVSRPIAVSEANVNVGASVGIAVSPEPPTSSASLLKQADEAMYLAKQKGGSRFILRNMHNGILAA